MLSLLLWPLPWAGALTAWNHWVVVVFHRRCFSRRGEFDRGAHCCWKEERQILRCLKFRTPKMWCTTKFPNFVDSKVTMQNVGVCCAPFFGCTTCKTSKLRQNIFLSRTQDDYIDAGLWKGGLAMLDSSKGPGAWYTMTDTLASGTEVVWTLKGG